uniref:semaphorin-7A n=1 Tax=Euleptes europaea TaxID=460621 RepID=UPI0025402757|nr:semaphorin-7A [Euleptes europaea]
MLQPSPAEATERFRRRGKEEDAAAAAGGSVVQPAAAPPGGASQDQPQDPRRPGRFFAFFWHNEPQIAVSATINGEKRFLFNTTEAHVTLYHKNGTSSVFVGAMNKLYYYDFETSEHYVEPFNITESNCENSAPCDYQLGSRPSVGGSSGSGFCKKHAQNYLTLVANYEGKLLVCGTNACSPACWNWVDRKKEPGIEARGLAPHYLEQNSFVLFYGDYIYSAISKNGGNLIRFRRVRGSWDLYSGDSLWSHPKLVQGAIIKNEEAYKDKIYLFFQEDNPEWPQNPEAPKRISRVAQLCAGDGGGSGALSSAKWSTFLKSTLHCFDHNTDRHFHLVQDVFVVHSEDWAETKIYALFSNEWGYSAVCVYSVGDITKIFETSPLLGFTGGFPALRPGQCIKGGKPTPSYTYKVANRHPEMEQTVKPRNILFHNKHRYQKIMVHSVQAANEQMYNVLYLATDSGTIHKIVNLPDGPFNILEIQPFQMPAAIQSMVLDSTKNVILVASENEVVELPTAMCEVYKDNCESCVLARDPYCGWIPGRCTSVYTTRPSLQSLSYEVPQGVCASSPRGDAEGDASVKTCTGVPPSSRYYLNCSLESHHAAYTWLHNNKTVARCDPGVDPCTHFIDRISAESEGNYSCVSQEDWFKQRLVTQCLIVKFPRSQQTAPPGDYRVVPGFQKSEQPDLSPTKLREFYPLTPQGNTATKSSILFWLELLHSVIIFVVLKG